MDIIEMDKRFDKVWDTIIALQIKVDNLKNMVKSCKICDFKEFDEENS